MFSFDTLIWYKYTLRFSWKKISSTSCFFPLLLLHLVLFLPVLDLLLLSLLLFLFEHQKVVKLEINMVIFEFRFEKAVILFDLNFFQRCFQNVKSVFFVKPTLFSARSLTLYEKIAVLIFKNVKFGGKKILGRIIILLISTYVKIVYYKNFFPFSYQEDTKIGTVFDTLLVSSLSIASCKLLGENYFTVRIRNSGNIWSVGKYI